jgi:predicted nucleotidyltransferase/HEPN domain-containing protein
MIELAGKLSYLPENTIRELEVITQRIIDMGQAEIIILYGSYARGNFKEKRGANPGKKSDYDILAVSPDVVERNNLRDELRDAFDDIDTQVQVIVETVDFINKKIKDNQFFFSDIKREGKILYNSGKYSLSRPQEMSHIQRYLIAEEDFREWKKQADVSYKYSQMAYEQSDFRKAAFELQQTVEICYKTIEIIFSRYIPYEHRLTLLRKRALKFARQIEEAFPLNNKNERDLFDHLDLAYIGARYHSEKEYTVTKEQLKYWQIEAKKLLNLTRNICKDKIAGFKEPEQK